MLSLICVPWMLIPKPLILWIKSLQSHKVRRSEHVSEDNLVKHLR